eukprot:CAMPEP_0119317798 /NCGR_PEP_ID=MMETSP1333-20130426/44364_1 /TAXON_ID=418940 /ORGANISM="Scyphosphaera apsteinii, Strain RCC1455" /LENGTH=76 /DNA_ID=CAMNT_0007323845 /DNA_START=208 /DNA_END=438 /DNA_ORIENTATION=-
MEAAIFVDVVGACRADKRKKRDHTKPEPFDDDALSSVGGEAGDPHEKGYIHEVCDELLLEEGQRWDTKTGAKAQNE